MDGHCQNCEAPISLTSETPFCAACLFGGLSKELALGASEDFALQTPGTCREDNPLPNGFEVGQYQIECLLDGGGMGFVYRARNLESDRLVALKMIRRGRFASESDFTRFRREVRAVSRLHHPHIIPVFDLGEWQSLPYYTMQLLTGGSLSDQLRQGPYPARKATALIVTISEAIYSAHQAGILHRDLKPGNILLDEDGTPYVTDFGVARDESTESSMTLTGQVLGTPSYLPPEQAEYSEENVGVTADVYSIGAVLYHLLTGRPPFKGRSSIETLQMVIFQDPEHPRHLVPEIPEDLATITLKCLEKKPSDRYPTAQALADDLNSWRNGFPITARPVSTLEKATKWATRQPLSAGLIVILLLTMITGIAAGWWQWRQTVAAEANEKIQRQVAEEALAEKSEQLNRVILNQANDFFAAQRAHLGLAKIARVLRNQPSHESAARHVLSLVHNRAIQVPQMVRLEGVERLTVAKLLGHGQTILGASHTGEVAYWNRQTGNRMSPLLPHSSTVLDVRRSADTTMTATATEDGTVYRWNHETAVPIGSPLKHPHPAAELRWTRDKRFLAVRMRGNVAQIWDLVDAERELPPIVHKASISSIDLSPDERWLVTGSHDGRIGIWDMHTAKLHTELDPELSWINSVRFHPNSQQILAAFSRRAAGFWNFLEPDSSIVELPHGNRVNLALYSPLAESAFSFSRDTTVVEWEPMTGIPLGSPLPHQSWVLQGWISEDGSCVATYTSDQQIHCWDLVDGERMQPNIRPQSPVLDFSFSKDQSAALIVTANGYFSEWLLNTPEPAVTNLNHPGRLGQFAVTSDAKFVATTLGNRQIILWRLSDGKRVHVSKRFRAALTSLRFINSDQQLEAVTRFGEIFTFPFDGTLEKPSRTAAPAGEDHVDTLISPDRQYAVLFGRKRFRAYSRHSRGPALSEQVLPARLNEISFTGDGRVFAAVSGRNDLHLFDTQTWEPLGTQQFDSAIALLTASDRGSALAFHSDDNNVYLLPKPSVGSPPIRLRHTGGIRAIEFAPSGKLLATACNDRSAWIWTQAGTLVAGPLEHRDDVRSVAFSPDEKLLATGTRNGDVSLWSIADGHFLGTLWSHEERVVQLSFSDDGRCLISASWDHTAKVGRIAPPILPTPGWLPDWLEAVAGIRFTDEKRQEPVPLAELYRLNQAIKGNAITGAYADLIAPLL